VIEADYNRLDIVVSILRAATFSRGVTLAKITEKVNLIEPTCSLKQYLTVLEKNGLLSFQKGEQVYITTYKGMNFLQNYKGAIDSITN
jgi:predicted transcriptional regulator